jgi:hypothetical protein
VLHTCRCKVVQLPWRHGTRLCKHTLRTHRPQRLTVLAWYSARRSVACCALSFLSIASRCAVPRRLVRRLIRAIRFFASIAVLVAKGDTWGEGEGGGGAAARTLIVHWSTERSALSY